MSKSFALKSGVKILLLGGSAQASACAQALALTKFPAIFSYAGRTKTPIAQPLPVRIGGFGGVAGLASFLKQEAITHVIDATHPFAAQMSAHAIAACDQAGIKLAALERPPWREQPGDQWIHVLNMGEAVSVLPETPARVFLAIGRQNIATFAQKPQHFYLLRLVDAAPADLPWPPLTHIILARGPFVFEHDLELLSGHKITHVVAKNSGGFGAYAKIAAARARGLPVVMIQRPKIPERLVFDSVEAVLSWL